MQKGRNNRDNRDEPHCVLKFEALNLFLIFIFNFNFNFSKEYFQ
jgi:hypothetical protein